MDYTGVKSFLLYMRKHNLNNDICSLSDDKLSYTKELIRCWVDSWGLDKVAISFSGGKDSTVLLHIARSIYPNIKGVFSNTGLEYLEIVNLVKNTPNVDIVHPKVPFHKVIEKYGWPVISKKVARFVSDCKNASDRNKNTVNLRLNGLNQKGQVCPSQMLSEKWRFLIESPFKISNRCCDILKKEPLNRYKKIHDINWMVGIMKVESDLRNQLISKYGCNMYDIKHPISYPLANWTDGDVWDYIHKNNVEYASVYDKGEKRTGCVFCMFGIMYDKDRFLRLKENSPIQYNYVINKLGASEVLDFIKIEY